MSTSTLSAVDAQTGNKVSLATFQDASGNTAVGHVALAGTSFAPVSPGNPFPVADSAAEASLATIGTNTATTAAAAGTPADAAWGGNGSGTLVALIKALYGKLAGTLTASLTGSLPAGTNALGSVSVSNLPAIQPVSGMVGVSGTVAVQDSAAEASLATIATNTAAPAARVLASRSAASTVAGGSTALVSANAGRRLLRVQAPQGAGVWLNLLGGTAGANALDCLYLAPGDVFEGQDTNAVTYWCATGGLILSAWES
jgi:hypothetical protein